MRACVLLCVVGVTLTHAHPFAQTVRTINVAELFKLAGDFVHPSQSSVLGLAQDELGRSADFLAMLNILRQTFIDPILKPFLDGSVSKAWQEYEDVNGVPTIHKRDTGRAINLFEFFKFLRVNFLEPLFFPAAKEDTMEDYAKYEEGELEDERKPRRLAQDGVQEVMLEAVSSCDADGNCSGETTPDTTPSTTSTTTEDDMTHEDTTLDTTQDPAHDTTQEKTYDTTQLEEKLGDDVTIGLWTQLYLGFIGLMAAFLILLTVPYFLDGTTYARMDYLGLVDQQDVLLALALLVEEATHDASCLERMVCLEPAKSSRYVSVASMVLNVYSLFQSWAPYNPRYEDLLGRMMEVVRQGREDNCHQYQCPGPASPFA